MDHTQVSGFTFAVVHITIAFLSLCSAIGVAFLSNRRIQADKRDNGMRCGECKRIERELRERSRKHGRSRVGDPE